MPKTNKFPEITKYKIIEVIGEGGMGLVYRAVDTVIKRNVAIKMMTESQFDKENARERFFREARAIGQLQHPNIITLYDAGVHEEKPYLVVEYLDGIDFRTMIKMEQLPPVKQILTIFIDICEALEYSHKMGIIHRDIKPANIFVLKSGTAKLMDFGIAKMDDSALTQTGTLLGTVHYMSPEQIQGKDIDYRTDIFALGVVMFEVFCRTRPFSGDSFTEILTKILFQEPKPFEPTDKSLPPVLSQIIGKCMEKDKEKRYQAASALSLDLVKIRTLFGHETATKKRAPAETTGLIERPGQKIAEPQKKSALPKSGPKKKIPPLIQKDRTKKIEQEPEPPEKKNWVLVTVFFSILAIVIVLVAFIVKFEKEKRNNDNTLLLKTPVIENKLADDQTIPTPEFPVDSPTAQRGKLDERTPVPETTPRAIDERQVTPTGGPDIAAGLGKAQSYYDRKDWQSALSSANEILKIDPKNGTALKIRDESQKMMQQQSPDSRIEKLLGEAEQAYNKKDYQGAIRICNDILTLQPDNNPARSLLARVQDVYDNQKRQEQRIEAAMKAGQNALNSGDLQTAESSFNEVLQLNPGNNDAQAYLRQIEKQKSEQVDPDLVKREMSKAIEAFNNNSYSEAIVHLNKVLEEEPNNNEAITYKKKAEVELEKDSTAAPSANVFQKLRGRQAFDKGEYQQCIDIMDKILKSDPNDKEARTLRAEAIAKLRGSGTVQTPINKDVLAMRTAFNERRYVECNMIINKILKDEPKNSEALDYKNKIKDILQSEKTDTERKSGLDKVKHHIASGNIMLAHQVATQLIQQYPDDEEIIQLFNDVDLAYKQSVVPTPTPMPEISIKYKSPDSVLTKKKFSVAMTFFGYDKPVDVMLYFRSTSEKEWGKEKMKEKGVYYQAVISGRDVKLPAMEYFFVISSKEGIVLFNGEAEPYRVKVVKESPGSIPVF